jgi:hypothetical protein
MVSVAALWLPILVGAVLVFIVSSIIHTVLGYHNSDFQGVPNEEAVRSAVGPLNIPPGDYVVPYCTGSDRKSDAFTAKINEGPVAMMTILPSEAFTNMGKALVQWFVYCLLTATVAAYVTGIAYGPGAEYMAVFRMSSTVAFAAYGWSLMQNSIWNQKDWKATGKSLFDAAVYGVLTAGALGWLWPAA